MSAIASILRQLSQAWRNISPSGAWPMSASRLRARTGATPTPPMVIEARAILPVDLQQRRRRDDGEVAVAAGELDESRRGPAGQSGIGRR